MTSILTYAEFEAGKPTLDFELEGDPSGTQIYYTGGTPGARGPASSARFVIKGAVANSGALPSTGQKSGDAWFSSANSHVYVWNATTLAWDDIGVLNGTGVLSPDGSVLNIRAMTQAVYDALPSTDANTFYIIKAP